MDDAKSQLVEKLKSANNVLVTVSRSPSVDQLSALLGLTLSLTKQGKHAAAVFSGQTPSTIEFLKPEETIEKNTDSLQDFIIALDKNKADKLRYKVEDDVVRIFITPYRTSISQEDLEFSQGDFNVDLVVTLGVQQQEDLDEAITSHGRILHDAVVASVTVGPEEGQGLGTINWHDTQASSLSEVVTGLAQSLGDEPFDNQIATALLTGIVAETERFSNDKTSSQTMSASAALMNAGANQQLIASKLEGAPADDYGMPASDASASAADDGTLQIDHVDGEPEETLVAVEGEVEPQALEVAPEPEVTTEESAQPPIQVDETETPQAPLISPAHELLPPEVTEPTAAASMVAGTEQPGLPELPADNSYVPAPEPAVDPLSLPSTMPAVGPPAPEVPAAEPVQPEPAAFTPPPEPAAPVFTPPPVEEVPQPSPLSPTEVPVEPITDSQGVTLTDLETAVDSPHLQADDVSGARDDVAQAFAASPDPLAPPNPDLNSQPSGDLHPNNETSPLVPGDSVMPTDTPVNPVDPNAPPPVPPPIPFQFDTPPQQ